MMPIIKNSKLRIDRLTLGAYETNAYILTCLKTGESLVIDAPAGASEIIKRLQGTKPKYILLTHDHYDHTGVIVSLRARLRVPLATHKYSSYGIKTPPEIFLNDGDTIKLGELTVQILYTPGHTAGSLCFLVSKYLFAGDTIFPGGPGRTETPEDFKQIMSSIKGKIYGLADETIVLPGHGDSTTVRQSKEEYTVFAGRTHESLYGDVTWLSG